MKTALYLSLIVLSVSCSQQKTETSSDEPLAASALPDANSVEMTIEPGPGSQDFIANCQTCHTARYALMQPKLSRKAWEKSVDKMIHVYGAEIDSVTARSIVNYLVNRQGG